VTGTAPEAARADQTDAQTAVHAEPTGATTRDDAPVTLRVDIAGPEWIAEHRDELRALLLRHGAVLLSGVGVTTAADVAAARDALGLGPVGTAEDFAPREDLGHGVHSAPAWPADREMCLHHERSQATDHPRLLLMACLRRPQEGGATLLADTRAVLAALPPPLAARFRDHGWLLTRNFRPHFGLPWSAAFGVTSPAEVERLCAQRDIRAEWLRDGTLHTTQRRPAVVQHPDTGEACWFNQVAFFNRWSLGAQERDLLLGTFGEHGIPFDTACGDGTPLSPEEFQSILDAYDSALRRVTWQAGDLLLVDNVLTAHGREPHTGERLVAVALAHSFGTLTA
jgi:alpha-ketoglutarate-dependent taurine dioxygenase